MPGPSHPEGGRAQAGLLDSRRRSRLLRKVRERGLTEARSEEVEVAVVVWEAMVVLLMLAEGVGVNVDQRVKSEVRYVGLATGRAKPLVEEADVRLRGGRAGEQAAERAVRRRARVAGAGVGEGDGDGGAPARWAEVVGGGVALAVDRHGRSHNIAAGCCVRSKVSASPWPPKSDAVGAGEGEREAIEGAMEARLEAGERDWGVAME